MTVVSGTVNRVSDAKSVTKGWSLGFKIDSFDGWFNVWGFNKDEVAKKFPFNMNDKVSVDYEINENGFNNVKRVYAFDGTVPHNKPISKFTDKQDVIIEKLDKIIKLLGEPDGHKDEAE